MPPTERSAPIRFWFNKTEEKKSEISETGSEKMKGAKETDFAS